MIHLEKRHFDILQRILAQARVEFYAFGSRAKDKNKSFSDLDLCYKSPIEFKLLVKIKGDLEDSDLPFRVDLIDWQGCGEDFRSLIANDLIKLEVSNLIS